VDITEHKKKKLWVICILSILLIFIITIMGINFFIDPNWSFSHEHYFNTSQSDFNERQTKANYLTYREESYDAILLGSSRTTYINQNEFSLSTFNYGVSAVSVQEFERMIDFALDTQEKEYFERIYIGLDFFATNANRDDLETLEETSNNAFEMTNNKSNRYTELLSIDTFENSVKNAIASFFKNRGTQRYQRSYDRNNIATALVVDAQTAEQNIADDVQRYKETHYGSNYKYNKNYKDIMQSLIDKYPNTEFIVFTNPIHFELFSAIDENNLEDDFNQWLKDIVEVFGEVHNFIGKNEITTDSSYYYDGHHYYEEVGTMIVEYLENPNIKDTSDFGQIIYSDNLETELENLFDID
jgi:hypothetical protein